MNDELTDEQWFSVFTSRQMRIRKAGAAERDADFETLGPHDPTRRHMLIYRLPLAPGAALSGGLMKIPYLLFADEEIENDDRVLIPIMDELMRNEAEQLGIDTSHGPAGNRFS